MLNLVGKNVSFGVPISVLKKIGNIDGTESIQSFYEKMFARVSETLTEDQKKLVEEYLPYVSSSLFVPIVVTNMIERNEKFADALTSSQAEIQLTSIQMRAVFGMLNIIPGASEMIESVIGEIIDALTGIDEKSIAMSSDSDKINVSIKELSPNFCAELAKLGILDIAGKISLMEKVSTAIRVKVVDPIFTAVVDAIIEEEHEEMDEEDKAEIRNLLDATAAEASITFPVQMILSTVITKAISDDITVAEAMATFDADQLVESTVEEIAFSDSLEKYAVQLKKAMSIAYRLA